MRTRLVVLSILSTIAAAAPNAGAQAAPKSADRLLRAVLATVQSQSTASRGFSRAPDPVFRQGEQIFVDRDDFDVQVGRLGFVMDHRATTTDVDGIALRNRAWSSIKSCTATGEGKPARCTIPPAVLVVRFFDVAASADGKEVTLRVGTYHRSDIVRGSPGIGGTVAEYTFGVRNGEWVVTKLGPVFAS